MANSTEKDMKMKPDSYWQETLDPKKYAVLRQAATEPPNSGALYRNHDTGIYSCAGCGQELFASTAKFESGSGWPSFDDPVDRKHVELIDDTAHGMRRTEVKCAACGAHLGHVFPDGPRETTGQRYCINSLALNFQGEDGVKKEG